MLSTDLSPTLQTLFAELVQQVTDAPPAGSIYRRERDGIAYYYAKIPVGTDRVDSFIGRVGDPVAEAQVETLRRGMEQARERRRLVAILGREGLANPDRLLGAMLDAIAQAGLFRNGAVLVGTTAYMLSEPHVGRRLPAPTLRTGDLDLATVNIALTAETDEGMESILRHADPTFQAVMRLDPRQPPSKFRNAHGYLYPELSPGCTACHACALICPDFVFQVWKYDEPVTHEETGDAA